MSLRPLDLFCVVPFREGALLSLHEDLRRKPLADFWMRRVEHAILPKKQVEILRAIMD